MTYKNKPQVLVIRIGRLGDTLMATAIIQPLIHHYGKDVLIDWAVSSGASSAILDLDTRVNQVFPIAHRRTPWRLHTVKRRLNAISRKSPYDVVINLEYGKECDDFMHFVNSTLHWGSPRHKRQRNANFHEVDSAKLIYRDLLGEFLTDSATPSLKLGESGYLLAPDLKSQNLVLLNPGFSGITHENYRTNRAWPISHWKTLAQAMTRAGYTVVINGTKEEKPYLQPILDAGKTYSLLGSTLDKLIAVIKHARCVISVDTGTMHLSGALGTPTIALFGPSKPSQTGPYSPDACILTSGIECQPCYGTPLRKKCHNNRCMQLLLPRHVLAIFHQMLEQKPCSQKSVQI